MYFACFDPRVGICKSFILEEMPPTHSQPHSSALHPPGFPEARHEFLHIAKKRVYWVGSRRHSLPVFASPSLLFH